MSPTIVLQLSEDMDDKESSEEDLPDPKVIEHTTGSNTAGLASGQGSVSKTVTGVNRDDAIYIDDEAPCCSHYTLVG